MPLKRLPKPAAETAIALIGTAFSTLLLVMTAVNAGPLWRDEVNTFNLAQMPSLKEMWNNMPFESFPPLWLLLLRGFGFLGMTTTDMDIRLLGLCVGLSFLALLWLCSRWIGARAPILSVALLGTLPAFIFTVGANRAYGLASCLLVLSFALIWRVVESPSRSRILWAGLVSVLFVQCVYYDGVFLCAMLFGGALVAIWRRQWKTLWALAGIGVVSGASMVIYLPIIHRGSAYLPMIHKPFFTPPDVWYGFCNALAAGSSAEASSANDPKAGLWVITWIELLLGGSVGAIIMQRTRGRRAQHQEAPMAIGSRFRPDLGLFCVAGMLSGILGYFAFLLRLQFILQPWYYIGILSLCAISLDGILSANWRELRPWGFLRIGFMVAVMACGARSGWSEAHTRRSNVDLAAAFLGENASPGDLIVVLDSWEGITFDRYYHGRARWVTVPPIDSHKVHRNDLVWKKINQPDAIAPVLREILSTLRSSNNIWLVESVTIARPLQLPPLPSASPAQKWLVWYLDYWNAQVTLYLIDHARQAEAQKIPANEPVSHFEDVYLVWFSGYKPDAN